MIPSIFTSAPVRIRRLALDWLWFFETGIRHANDRPEFDGLGQLVLDVHSQPFRTLVTRKPESEIPVASESPGAVPSGREVLISSAIKYQAERGRNDADTMTKTKVWGARNNRPGMQ